MTGACYLVLQIVTVGALGEAAGAGRVPLLTLAGLGSPGFGSIAVGVIAAIVALGVLNVYLAAFAKLGASLADNGDLPRWFAPGAESGGIPRRALALTGVVVAVYVGAHALVGPGPHAVHPRAHEQHGRDLRRRHDRRRPAARRRAHSAGGWPAIAVVLCVGMLALAVRSLLPALVLAVAAVVVTLVQRHRGRAPVE